MRDMIARGMGCVMRTLGETVLAALPGARVGDGVRIRTSHDTELSGEVAAVERARVAIVPFGPVSGVAVGNSVEIASDALLCRAGFRVLGRALDAAGKPLDGKAAPTGRRVPVERSSAPRPCERTPVDVVFWTGIRTIDGLLTVGRGARVGIFGGPGAGKTTLLETIVAGARADAVVLALVGERGREAQAWFERIDARTAICCATSDRAAAERIRAADVAMTQAQDLRERGLHVVLIVDSLARYAAALREQRVALGEPVGRGGYPASVWPELARYLERAGNASGGSITLLATVLSDGADEREPLGDAARSLLDGHIVLSSALARAGHYPAIDVLASTSRTMGAVVSAQHVREAHIVRAALALLAETEDARAVGLSSGSDPALAAALAAQEALRAFLHQREPAGESSVRNALAALAARLQTPS